MYIVISIEGRIFCKILLYCPLYCYLLSCIAPCHAHLYENDLTRHESIPELAEGLRLTTPVGGRPDDIGTTKSGLEKDRTLDLLQKEKNNNVAM